MRYAYTVTQPESWQAVFESGQRLTEPLTGYLAWLQTLGAVTPPRGIVFHDFDSATTIFSTHVLPAWTDLSLIHMDPLVEDWKRIYLSALTEEMPASLQARVRAYYESLDRLDIATILAHELTHHLLAFSQTPEEATWFEEGFCFYVPRKQLLSADRLAQLQHLEKTLIDTHDEQLGSHPIWQFGLSNTGEGFTEALFDYWRAIYAVSKLIDHYARGDSRRVLGLFNQWNDHSQRVNRLDEFLIDALGVSEADQRDIWLLSGASP